MNIKELNESVKENQKSVLEENIKDIENRISWIASNGLNYFKIATYDYDDYYYTIRKWMIEPLRDYFENEGYKVEVKEVCEAYRLGISTADLAKEFNMGRTSIINYLKSGAKLGWCTYDAKEEMRRSGRFSGKLYGGYNRKQVLQFTLEGELIKKYDTAREAARKTGIDYGNISHCCNGRHKTAGGFIWKYLE